MGTDISQTIWRFPRRASGKKKRRCAGVPCCLLERTTALNEFYQAGYSKRTLNLFRSTIQSIFQLVIKENPSLKQLTDDMNSLTIPRSAPTKKVEPIKQEEESIIWNVIPPNEQTARDLQRAQLLPLIRMWALTQLCCGLRREEVAALEWSSIDFHSRDMRICQAYDFKVGKIKPPKSDAGNRIVYMPQDYISELRVWKQQNPCSRYVFELDIRSSRRVSSEPFGIS